MAEARIDIEGSEHLLEGLFARGEASSTGGILCHPHPLYGGDMQNEMVSIMQRAFGSRGWSTLRFNFRGVGASGGEYGEGKGEADDVQSAAKYLFREGIRELHLAGYSFGAWVALRAVAAGLQPASLILVSPPLDLLDFTALQLPSCPCLITLGDRDDFCAASSLHEWLRRQNNAEASPEVATVPNCDHFYWGHEAALFAMVSDFLSRHFNPGAV